MVVTHEATRTGAPKVALELLRALEAQGAETVAVLRWGGPLTADFVGAADHVAREPLRFLRAALLRWGWTKRSVVPRVERWVARALLLRWRPDLVWCNTVISAPYAVAAARMGVPSVVHSHEQEDLARRVVDRNGLRGVLGEQSPPVLVGCAPEAAASLGRVVGVDPDHVIVLPSPVDADAVRRSATALRHRHEDPPVVLACGTADRRKGADVFAQAASMAEDRGLRATWRWIGDDVLGLGGTAVEWSGPTDDAAAQIAAADVFVLPSRADAFPLVVLEAMALARPIIATELPGTVEQLGETGVLVAAEDAAGIVDAVESLLCDSERAEELGSAASRRCAERWDLGPFRESVANISAGALASPTGTTSARPLLITHLLWRLTPGAGIQIVVRRLARGLDPLRFGLRIVTARATVDPDVEGDIAVTTATLGLGNHRTRLWRLALVLGAALELGRPRPDVVHLHSGTAWIGVLARLRLWRTPFVLEVHDAPGAGRHGAWTDRFEGWMVRRLRVAALCHSSSVADEVQRRWRPPAGAVTTFPLSVDTDLFNVAVEDLRRQCRREFGVPEDAFVLVAAGRLAPSKRFDLATELLHRLSELGVVAHLVLVGRGPEGDRLEALAAELGVTERVHRTGQLLGDDLARAFAAADVLVSTSDYEGFGLTLIEAMASGLPVVAMAVGGVTDIVQHGSTGYLVPPGDVDGFVRHLVDLSSSRPARERLGVAARSRAEEVYGVSRMCAAFATLYEGLARRNP
jgi:glycosyltransferase involved in cell wall biosynthesis